MSDKLIALSKALHRAVALALFGTPDQKENGFAFMRTFIGRSIYMTTPNGSSVEVDNLLRIAPKENRFTFKSIDQFIVVGRGLIFQVSRPHDLQDCNLLKGQVVTIDNKEYVVNGMEYLKNKKTLGCLYVLLILFQ